MERWLFLALSLSLFLWQNSSTAAVSLIPSRWKLRGCSTLIRPRDNRVLVFSLSSFSFSSFCVFFRPFSLVEGRRWGGAYRREARLYQVPFSLKIRLISFFLNFGVCVCVCTSTFTAVSTSSTQGPHRLALDSPKKGTPPSLVSFFFLYRVCTEFFFSPTPCVK